MKRLEKSFFLRDVLTVSPELLGKYIVVKNNQTSSYKITDVEAYKGEADKACHANKGRTARTEIMYHEGGFLYVYLIYGMYWMLNIVTGEKDNPQAILIRGIKGFSGPGKVSRELGINKSYYGLDITTSSRIWIEEKDRPVKIKYSTGPRIGIDYAGEYWKQKPWRFYINNF